VRFLDVVVVTPPAGEVVTAQEFIDHARLNALTVDRQPDLIERELRAATARAENFLRRSLLTQTLKAMFVPEADCGCSCLCACSSTMTLPRGPVTSVTSILSHGQDVSDFHLEWNTVVLDAPLSGAAEVTYISAGFGAAGADVPDPVREGILEYAAVLYDDRVGARESKYVASAGRTLPAGVLDLWRPYQIEVGG
jgi:uncharacterized phiE125 gp8 family phage protein